MKEKKTNVILTNYPMSNRKPTKIKIGNWTDAQKQEFLNNIYTHLGATYNCHCTFSVHFDKSVVHVRSFDKPKTFMPIRSKNKENELIIEIIPRIGYFGHDCWAGHDSACPKCIQDGLCELSLIRQYVGQTLFPERYTNQK